MNDTFLNHTLEHVLNNIADGIFIADSEGYTLWVNDMSTKQLGTARENLIGKHVDDLEKEGFFNISVTKEVIKQQKQISTVQESLNRQYLSTGKLIQVPETNTSYILVQVKDITDTVRSSLKLEKAESLLKKYWDELQNMKNSQQKQAKNLIVGSSDKHAQMMKLIDSVAHYDATILLEGETGVGKSLIAEEIHLRSNRSDKPFLQVNCGAIPENLLESELFGYKRGAFTGASQAGKVGLAESANGGTLFLDEIAELPITLQPKILQLVQDKTFIPIGSSELKKVDIRIIAATNEDLLQLIEEKRFRRDLYYRLNVVSVRIPALKERKEDIVELVYHYLHTFMLKYGKNVTIDDGVLHTLQSYDWPGNIRELENMMERLVVTATSNQIDVESLPSTVFLQKANKAQPIEQDDFFALDGQTLPDFLDEIEKEIIMDAQRNFPSTRKAAKYLGITQPTYMRRLKKYNL